MNLRPSSVSLLGLSVGLVFVAASATLAVVVGPTDIDRVGVIVESIDRLTPLSLDSDLTASQRSIVWNLRLPRVALGLLVGAALATAGASYQGIFRNPLADPYLLGVAAGGGLGATAAFAWEWGDGQGVFDGVQIAAFVGALTSVALTYVVGVLGDRSRSATSLILAGVAVASFFTAMQTFVQQQNSDDIRRVYSWILGGLTTSGWNEVLQLAPVAVVGVLALSLAGRTLDVLAVGDEEASVLGLSVGPTRVGLIVIASLVTAAAVAVSGLIAFVGLIVPHTVRLLFGSSFRVIVPLSVAAGGGFLVLCDLAARTILSPAELPIGVITAFFGAPFFIVILRTAATR